MKDKQENIKIIGIDARFYGPIGKGLGRYTQEIVDNIIRISTAESSTLFRFVIFLGPDNYDEFNESNPLVKRVLVRSRWYSLAEQFVMPYYLIREKVDLVHFPHFNVPVFITKKFVVTIHDLILTKFPTVRASTLSPLKYKLKNLAYRVVIFLAIKRASKIITVSQFTKNDIISQFGARAAKIAVTYEGVANLSRGNDSLFVAKLDEDKTLNRYHISQNFLLYVGNAYPHKNLESLIKNFARLRSERPDLKLVLVGKEDYFYSRLKNLAASFNLWQKGNVNSPVVFPGYVPDAQLEVLYQNALAYIFPSLYEGFGLPPLEAMAKSCPVLSSNQASLPEILGDAALYFDPYQAEDFFNKLKKIIGDESLRDSLRQRGREQAKRYNWWECALETWEVYRKILLKSA